MQRLCVTCENHDCGLKAKDTTNVSLKNCSSYITLLLMVGLGWNFTRCLQDVCMAECVTIDPWSRSEQVFPLWATMPLHIMHVIIPDVHSVCVIPYSWPTKWWTKSDLVNDTVYIRNFTRNLPLEIDNFYFHTPFLQADVGR